MSIHNHCKMGLRRSLAVAGALVALPVTACSTDRILEVEDPDILRPEQINTVEALPFALNAAIGDFAVAYVGNGFGGQEGLINTSGLLADELKASGTFPTRNEVDRRAIRDDNATMQDVFRVAQRARATAERAADAFGRLDAQNVGRAEALSLVGYSYVLTGESYCSGVPFSRVISGSEFEYGTPLTTPQIFEAAIQRFDSALVIAQAADTSTAAAKAARLTQINLALIGKGRAQLNMGMAAAAAATVAPVPDGFTYLLETSENTDRQNNGVWAFNANQRRYSVADTQGTNGLPYRSAADPRVLWSDARRAGFDRVTPLFLQLKYPERSSPVPLATGAEARLIEAEAALDDPGVLMQKLNAARAVAVVATPGVVVPALTADAVPADRNARVDLLFRERAFGLWLTAHRLGDMRRLLRQYGRTQDQVFPVGLYHKGTLPFGDDVSFPVPVDELNNPSAATCDNSAAAEVAS